MSKPMTHIYNGLSRTGGFIRLHVARLTTPVKVMLFGFISLIIGTSAGAVFAAGQHASLTNSTPATPAASEQTVAVPDKEITAATDTPSDTSTPPVSSDTTTNSSQVSVGNQTVNIPDNGSVHQTMGSDDSNAKVDVTASNNTSSTNNTTHSTSHLHINTHSTSDNVSTHITNTPTNTSD